MAAIDRKSPPQLAKMRAAGRLVAEALQLVGDIAEPGVTTAQLDRAAADHISNNGGVPAFKDYRGFPANICTSLNEEIVHGIPGPRKLREGDLLKVDVGVIWEGWYGDAAVTVPIGDIGPEARELMQVTREALNVGISVLRPGVRLSELSSAVQETAESHGFSVVKEYTGHGIGRSVHEEPKVPNFVQWRLSRADPVLETGNVLAIEPMLNVGTHRTKVLENGWTVVTRDARLSAHFEHTVAVGDNGPVILTLP